ncbi:MAG: TorF family putative porin [Pseudomonadales bacterium]|nr:TorF family putative porin [Pseudomonadales bacterium]
MKKLLTMLTAVVAMALTVPAAVAAEVAGNVTLASDYSFRGWSQTGRDPAIQGGFDVAFESGFSLGTWASNVNFGDTSMEWDLYMGWSGEISDGMELGVQLIHFQYPNDTDLNYQWGTSAWGSTTRRSILRHPMRPSSTRMRATAIR